MPGRHARRYATGVNFVRRLQALRAAFDELGPLRPIAVYVALSSTLGTVLLCTNLPSLARALPESSPSALLAVVLGGSIALAAAWLPPAAMALGAGYCLGALHGTWAAVLAVGLGSLLLRGLAPWLGAAWFPSLRERPRAAAVRTFCRGGGWAAVLAVARLRWAGPFPLAATNLLLAVAAVPARSVLVGSWLGAVPAALLLAVAGDGLRTWRDVGEWPDLRSWLVVAAALLAGYMLRRASRRAWRAVRAPA